MIRLNLIRVDSSCEPFFEFQLFLLFSKALTYLSSFLQMVIVVHELRMMSYCYYMYIFCMHCAPWLFYPHLTKTMSRKRRRKNAINFANFNIVISIFFHIFILTKSHKYVVSILSTSFFFLHFCCRKLRTINIKL